MSKFRGLISPHQLEEDTIVQCGESFHRRNSTSLGYVQECVYDIAQTGKPLLHFIVYPVMTIDLATKTGRPSFILDTDKVDPQRELGLPPGQWAIVIDPTPIHPDEMGRRGDKLVTGLGNLRQTSVYNDFQDMAERYTLRPPEEGPRFAQRNSDNVWGLYLPLVKKGKNALEDFEVETNTSKKAHGKNKNKQGVAQLDMSLENAIKAGILDADKVKLLTDPEDKRVHPIKSLREAFTIADKSPGDLAKYAPKKMELAEDVSLEDLKGYEKGQIHPTIVWGLSLPRDGKKGTGAEPILDLKKAFEMVTHSPGDMEKYNYLGKAYQERAKIEIPAAYQKMAKSHDNHEHFAIETAKEIRKAWLLVSNAHSATRGILDQAPIPVPERFIGEDGKPLWTFDKR